jgi:exodeoxyribonuclease III
MSLRLISWNVNKRRAIDQQVEALANRQPDLIALQEVTAKNLAALRDLCAQIGLPYVLDSKIEKAVSHRGYVVIASRWPLTRKRRRSALQPLPCAEGTATALIASPYGTIELHAVHVPNASNPDQMKWDFLEELVARLTCHCAHHRILCGDFNFPQRELSDGVVITFGERIRKNGTYHIRRGRERQALAERAILVGLAAHNLRDVYRSLNGFTSQEYSWVARNRGRSFGFRLDHILASEALRPQECHYLHPLRETGLSDHSPIEAMFAPLELRR